MKILVTRPQSDAEETARQLAAMGHQVLVAPLMTPHFSDGPELGLEGIKAILATSANGIRALARRSARRDLPVFAVGPQTAEEARRLGFADVRSADGDAAVLADAACHWARPGDLLLHACSQEAPGKLAEMLAERGFEVRSQVLYRMEAAGHLPAEVHAALQAGTLDSVLFFSPRSAQIFANLAKGLPLRTLAAFCISAATADALPANSFAKVLVADAPNQAAMLALIGLA